MALIKTRITALLLGLTLLAATAHSTASAAGATVIGQEERIYQVDYEAHFEPAQGEVHMQVVVRQQRKRLRKLSFTIDPERYRDFHGDGEIEAAGDRISWVPPGSGGTLSYTVVLDHQRRNGGFDSMMTSNWAIFRGDDLLPPVAVRASKGARSQARLRMRGPDDWSFISAYPRPDLDSEWFEVDWTERKFDRPVGWMAAGKLGVLWGDISATRLAIAGPTGHGIRRQDMMAFLRWNLPTLKEIFPEFPQRILLVSAGDPMWRGGLSGPHSLFIHADRPLISGNGTSTLLHELVHLAQGYGSVPGEDWIIEAMAEYYTLEVMRRSGTLSNNRYKRGHGKLEAWSADVEDLEADNSSGSRTARGVAVLQDLDTELRAISHDKFSLDDVVRRFADDGVPVSTERLRQISAELAGQPLHSISPKQLATD